MALTTEKDHPILATSASGDKLIVFTPGKDHEYRTEADIIRNEFGGYEGVSSVEPSNRHIGWLTFSFSVMQFLQKVLVVDVLMFEGERFNPDCGTAVMFSHLAIGYEGGAHVVAVQSKYSDRWYYNTSAPEFADIY